MVRVSKVQRLVSIAEDRAGFAARGLNARAMTTILLAYVVLTVVFTYPVALDIMTEPAGSTDVYEYMWELWWAKRSLVDLQRSPADVTALYHPYGAYHPLLLLDAYLMLTSLPMVMLFSPAAATNLHLLASYVLTGFATYLLCHSLTRRHWPAFIGGAMFAFSPFRSDRAAHGVISMALTYWLPFYVLFLLRLFQRPRLRTAILCGICLGFSILSSFLHLAHFVVPLTLVFLVYKLFVDRKRLYSPSFLRRLALALGLAGVMILPPYAPLLMSRLAGELDYFSRFGILGHSAALLSFVVPPSFQAVVAQFGPLQGLVQELLPGRYYVVYLGLVSLALALLGMVNRKTRLWALLAMVSGVLALGPLLHVTGELMELTVAGRTGFVVLPGALLANLPFYEWARGPARFAELTIFSVAVMASYGVLVLYRLPWGRIARLAVLCALLALLLLDYALFIPFPTQAVSVPGFYSALQGDPEDHGILDVGTERFNHEGMYFQTTHQHPIARGFIYRYPSESHYYQAFLEQLMSPKEDIINGSGFAPIVEQLGIRLVVLHKLSATTVEEMGPFLSETLGEPVYEDRQIVVHQVAEEVEIGEDPIPLLMLGEQWHPLESVGGVPSRWMVNDGVVYARVDTPGQYQLALTAHPFQGPRYLQIYVEGELLEEYHVGGMQSYVTSAFTLEGGEWVPIRFHVPEGCQVPSQVLEGQGDDRCLSMLFQALEVFPVKTEV